MEKIWGLILVSLFATNSLDKTESVQLEDLPLQTFDELFVEEWLDNDEADDLKTPPPTNCGQNVHQQIDRQNTQIGQIEPNSTDQNPALTESDHLGQIEPNSTDQNNPLTESDHFDNAKNGEEQNQIMKGISSNKKRKIVDKFHAIKEEFRQKGNFSAKEWNQIERKIANHLNVSRLKIYKWKKAFGLNQNTPKNKRKYLVEKFDQMKAELKRDGCKNSYNHEIDETVAKELDLSLATIYKWKRKLGQSKPNKHSQSEQKELLKRYYQIKNQNPKIIDKDIAKMLNIGIATLVRWKKEFKRQQLHLNSVDGHSVEENAAANIQEIGNLELNE